MYGDVCRRTETFNFESSSTATILILTSFGQHRGSSQNLTKYLLNSLDLRESKSLEWIGTEPGLLNKVFHRFVFSLDKYFLLSK